MEIINSLGAEPKERKKQNRNPGEGWEDAECLVVRVFLQFRELAGRRHLRAPDRAMQLCTHMSLIRLALLAAAVAPTAASSDHAVKMQQIIGTARIVRTGCAGVPL